MLSQNPRRQAAGIAVALTILLTAFNQAQAQCHSLRGNRPGSSGPVSSSATSRLSQPATLPGKQLQRLPTKPAPITDLPVSGIPQQSAEEALPALNASQIDSVPNGSRLRIKVQTGAWQEGMAILAFQGTTMLIRPDRWEAGSVTVQLPEYLLDAPASAQLFIAANPDTLLEKVNFSITPRQ